MTLTIVLTGVLTAGLVLAGLFYIIFTFKRRLADLITRYLTQPDEKTPSQVAIFVDQMSMIAAQRIVTQVKTTFMGMSSVDYKNSNKEALAAVTGGNPALATLLQLIPGVGRRLAKNPELLSLAGGLLNKSAGNNHKEGGVKSPF